MVIYLENVEVSGCREKEVKVGARRKSIDAAIMADI